MSEWDSWNRAALEEYIRATRERAEKAEGALRTIREIMCDKECCGHFLPEEIRAEIAKVIGPGW